MYQLCEVIFKEKRKKRYSNVDTNLKFKIQDCVLKYSDVTVSPIKNDITLIRDKEIGKTQFVFVFFYLHYYSLCIYA